MGSRAIYTIIEKGEVHHFYSQWAANEYTPFTVIREAKSLKDELSLKQTTAQLIPLIKYNHYFNYEVIGLNGKSLFERLPKKQAEKMLFDFGNNAAISMNITLDFDNDKAYFRYNSLCFHFSFSDFAVSISDGLHCLDQVIKEEHCEKDILPTIIQWEMKQKLKEFAVPLEQQGPQISL